MTITRDPIEKTQEYVNAMMKVLPILDEEYRQGKSPEISYWKRKQELLLKFGLEWQSPADLNPEIIKD